MAQNILKIAVVGDLKVGKTSLIKQFVYGEFSGEHEQVLLDFQAKTIKSDQEYTLQILDQITEPIVEEAIKNRPLLEGKEFDQSKIHNIFAWIKSQLYGGTHGALIVSDLTRKDTYEKLPEYIDEIRSCVGDIPVLIVGNKNDLYDQRQVPKDVSKYIPNGSSYIELSATDKLATEYAFMQLVEEILNK